ncbi:YdcF family protein [Mesoflavibacter profundi]|uniref:YdcF family protein n=2 Tax=Mesoflavibacter profundi TaxID=2708110 RepID=A0ABT4RZE0_9FLAO|nr:ElyC/SanA/YdcF family protein [Mesoflavibacter profundi]MDA0177198.1 YdcF family protein [Mesoflavibacter profundi]
MKRLKQLFKLGGILLLAVILCNFLISYKAKNKTFDNIENLPTNKVGLVLGAGKITSNGYVNLYYKYRLEAAYLLWKNNKIDKILISGDNSRKDYDEPSTFKSDLIQLGVPETDIYLDYAGFRTLDSVVRAKKIFGLENVTIISQKFHNERAIYLAENFNLNATAFNAKDVSNRYGFKTKIREYLARTKAVIDVIMNKQPKYLGPKVEIS